MSQFKYKAKNAGGQEYERIVEANDRLALYGVIRTEGGTVISIQEIKKLSLKMEIPSPFARVKTQEKISFAKNLGAMINAGLSVVRALGVLSKQSKSAPFKELISGLEADVSHGTTLAEALGKRPKVFPPLFVSMVKAGEESGSVASSLLIVGNQMEKAHLLAKKIRGAMIYPAVIIGVMIILSILLLIFMVPTLTQTFEGIGVQLPLPTRIIIYLSDFLVENTLLVLGMLIALVVALAAFFKSAVGKNLVDRLSLRIPAVGEMIKEVQAARTARTLSSLLSAGVEIVSALSVTSEVLQNHLYKNALINARDSIQKGEQTSTVLARYPHLYPAFISEMTSVGEETGKIAEMLAGAADYYEDSVDQKTKDLSTIIEPLLMVVIGAGVGIFAISMLMPAYSLVNYI